MPEMVGLFNGFGGGASVLVAGSRAWRSPRGGTWPKGPDMQMKVATGRSPPLIGSVTFFGSYVAFGKLAEFLAVKWKLYPWQKIDQVLGSLLATVARRARLRAAARAQRLQRHHLASRGSVISGSIAS